MTGSPFTKQSFTLLTIIITFALVVVYEQVAQAQPSTLSGRVIGTKGEPIAETPIALLYVKSAESGGMDTLYDRALYPFLRQRPAHFNDLGGTPDESELQARPPFLKSETDSEGRFTFTDIAAGMVQLMVLTIEKEAATPPPGPQNVKPVPEIQSIRFGKVAFYPHDFSFFPPLAAVTHAIKPGSDIKDVEIVIETQPKPKIQGRLVFRNGEPLADMTVKFDTGHLDLTGIDDSVFSHSLQTDSDGNFVFVAYVPGIYGLSVNHRGLSATSVPFTVEAGKPNEAVVLTLNGNPTDLSELTSGSRAERRYGVPDVPGAWIVNPANGHAYKWITCDDQKDAQAKAAAEEAHLVTITSEAEQTWLEAIFKGGPYWIGLTDALKEGEWMWETGEPVTYTNWGKKEEDIDLYEPPALLKPFIDEDDIQHEVEGEDYVIMSSRHWAEDIGKWYPASSGGAGHHGRASVAILEKGGMRSKVHGLSLPDEE